MMLIKRVRAGLCVMKMKIGPCSSVYFGLR